MCQCTNRFCVQSPLSSVETHESFQEAVVTRGYVSASMFAFGITSSDALEQLIQDILLNTEALGSTLGVTAANANISPHAASIRRAWHESWALCHRTSSNQQWTPSDLLWSDAPPPKLTLETQRAALGIPGKLSRRTARLKQHSRPAVLGTGLRLPLETREPSHVDALDPDHQRDEAHGALGDERPTTPFQHGTLMCWEDVPQIDKASLSAGPWRINRILHIRSNAFALCGGVIWHRTRHLTPNCWPALPINTQPTAGSALRICPNSCPLIAF